MEKIIRSIGFLISLLIVFTYHLNWLLHLPLTLWNATLLIALVDILIFFIQRSQQLEKFKRLIHSLKPIRLKSTFLSTAKQLCIPLLLILIALFYFKGDLSVPRYATADAGEHYLQMLHSAKTGLMPQFFPDNGIFVASGYDPNYKYHNETYFAGATIPFFFIYNILPTGSKMMSLQLFNVIFYAILVSYLFFSTAHTYLSGRRIWYVILFFLLALGAIFDFFITSNSTQIFGLFILIFFADSFYQFYKKHASFIPPAVGLAALLMSYVYWAPPAFILIGIFFLIAMFINWKEGFRMFVKNIFLKNFFIFVIASLVFSCGYLINMFRVNLLGYSTAGGGFSLATIFLSDTIIILPLAFAGLYISFKKQINKSFLPFFTFAVLGYTTILYALYTLPLQLVSNYVRLKVLYITIPLLWIFAIFFLAEIIPTIKKIKKPIALRIKWKRHKGLYLSILLGVTITAGNVIIGNSVRLFPILQRNIEFMQEPLRSANITNDQLKLLDKIKKDYSWTLQDNRIFIIAPYDTALLIYAYSGIWPRTYSLLTENDKINKTLTGMSLNSEGIAEYVNWLSNDKQHLLIYFDTAKSRSWIDLNGFDFNDYDVLSSVGNNKLLRLKNNSEAKFSYQNDIPGIKNKNVIALPYEEEFRPKYDNFYGLVFFLSVINKSSESGDKYSFSLYDGSCSSKGQIIIKKEITIDEIKSLKEKDQFAIFFNNRLENIKGKTLCMQWDVQSGKGKGMMLVSSKKTEKLIIKELYKFTNLSSN